MFKLLLPPTAPTVPTPAIPATPPASVPPSGLSPLSGLQAKYSLPPTSSPFSGVAEGFFAGGATAAYFSGPAAPYAAPAAAAFAFGFGLGSLGVAVYNELNKPKEPVYPAPLDPPAAGDYSIGKLVYRATSVQIESYDRSAKFRSWDPPIDLPLIFNDPSELFINTNFNSPILTAPNNTGFPFGSPNKTNDRYGNDTSLIENSSISGFNGDYVLKPNPTPNNGGTPAPAAPPPEKLPDTAPPPIPDTPPPPLFNPIPDGTPQITPFSPKPATPSVPPPEPEPEPEPEPAPAPAPPVEPEPPILPPSQPSAPPEPDPDPTPDPDPQPPLPPAPSPSPSPSPSPAPAPAENPPINPVPFPAPAPSPTPPATDPEPTPPPIIFPIAPVFPDPQPLPTPNPTPQPQTPVDPFPGQPPAPAKPQQPSPTPKSPTQPSQPPQPAQPQNPETPVPPSPTPLPDPSIPFGLTVPDGNIDPDGISEDPYEEGIFKDPDEYPGDGMGIGIPPGNVPTSPIPNFGVPQVPGLAPITPPVPLTPPPVVSTPPPITVPFTPVPPVPGTLPPPVVTPPLVATPTTAPIVPVTPPGQIDPCKSSSIDPCTTQISDTLKTNAALTTANAAGIAALAAGFVPVPTPVKIFVKCENNAPVYGVQVVGIPANQVGYVPALFEKIANTEGKACNECNAIATVPEWWQLRPEANRPQGILVFKEVRPDGTIGKDPYSITIPHCTLTAAPTTSPLTTYQKGSIQGILTLKDNSKLIVNCKDKEECDRVIVALSAVISSTQLNGSSTKIGDRKGLPFKEIEVKAQRLDFYPNGVETMKPAYIKSFF